MPVYLVAQLEIHDRKRYAVYGGGFMDIFTRYNGKLLAVDESPELLEGEWAFTRTVLLEFPSKEDADSWYHSNEYQELAQHRYAASEGNLILIEGLEREA